MTTPRLLPLLCSLCLAALTLSACDKSGTTSPADTDSSAAPSEGGGEQHDEAKFEGREVVDNWKAQDGEVTVCPISGKKFEVSEASGRWDYEGYTFVFCCAGDCLDQVKADPDKFLGELVQQAQAETAAEGAEEPTAEE